MNDISNVKTKIKSIQFHFTEQEIELLRKAKKQSEKNWHDFVFDMAANQLKQQ